MFFQEKFYSPLILNPTFWLDASDFQTILDANGKNPYEAGFLGKIASWKNKAKSIHQVVQATDAKRPLIGPARMHRGLYVPEFNGTGHSMGIVGASSSSGLFDNANQSIFGAYYCDNNTTNTHLIASLGLGGQGTRTYFSNQSMDFGSGILNVPFVDLTQNTIIVQAARKQSGAEQRLKVNNKAEVTLATNRQANSWTGAAIGAYGDQTNGFFKGLLLELYVVPGYVSAARTNETLRYLADKWSGITSDVAA